MGCTSSKASVSTPVSLGQVRSDRERGGGGAGEPLPTLLDGPGPLWLQQQRGKFEPSKPKAGSALAAEPPRRASLISALAVEPPRPRPRSRSSSSDAARAALPASAKRAVVAGFAREGLGLLSERTDESSESFLAAGPATAGAADVAADKPAGAGMPREAACAAHAASIAFVA